MQGQIVLQKNKKTQQVQFPVTVEEAIILKNGQPLTETYNQLLNENRVLKEEIEEQNHLINIIMTSTDMMYFMLEPLLADVLVEDKTNSLVDMYVAMVKRGLKTVEEIPTGCRKEVELILNGEELTSSKTEK